MCLLKVVVVTIRISESILVNAYEYTFDRRLRQARLGLIDISINRNTGVRRAIYVMNFAISIIASVPETPTKTMSGFG
jgi:hypothetical protein